MDYAEFPSQDLGSLIVPKSPLVSSKPSQALRLIQFLSLLLLVGTMSLQKLVWSLTSGMSLPPLWHGPLVALPFLNPMFHQPHYSFIVHALYWPNSNMGEFVHPQQFSVASLEYFHYFPDCYRERQESEAWNCGDQQPRFGFAPNGIYVLNLLTKLMWASVSSATKWLCVVKLGGEP